MTEHTAGRLTTLYTGVLLHYSGIHPARYPTVEADGPQKALEMLRGMCPAGRYVSRIYTGHDEVTVWEEGKGFTDA